MEGKIITSTIGAGRRNLSGATVGMVVATATAGGTFGPGDLVVTGARKHNFPRHVH